MLLAAEIREASDLSPDIQTHATAISDIFDPFFYLTEYQDVALDGVNPLLHYVTKDIVRSVAPRCCSIRIIMPTERGSGRATRFSITSARVSAADSSRIHCSIPHFTWSTIPTSPSGVNPLFHYQTWGGRERRDPSPLFDTEYYLESRNLGASSEIRCRNI